jgi:hypothetical protein
MSESDYERKMLLYSVRMVLCVVDGFKLSCVNMLCVNRAYAPVPKTGQKETIGESEPIHLPHQLYI